MSGIEGVPPSTRARCPRSREGGRLVSCSTLAGFNAQSLDASNGKPRSHRHAVAPVRTVAAVNQRSIRQVLFGHAAPPCKRGERIRADRLARLDLNRVERGPLFHEQIDLMAGAVAPKIQRWLLAVMVEGFDRFGDLVIFKKGAAQWMVGQHLGVFYAE